MRFHEEHVVWDEVATTTNVKELVMKHRCWKCRLCGEFVPPKKFDTECPTAKAVSEVMDS